MKDFDFVNGGVFGYGTLQALMRAQEISKKNDFDHVIIQTLVGQNFIRDKLDIRSGFPKPYLKKSGQELVVVSPPPFSLANTKYGPTKLNFGDYIMKNLTFLSEIHILRRLRNVSSRKFEGNINRLGKNSGSIPEIIDYLVRNSKELNESIIWLLQYGDNYNRKTNLERKLIINTLKKYNLPFIDTYNSLHVNTKYPSKKLWFGHHTPLGNSTVCGEIVNYFKNNFGAHLK